LRRFYLRRRPSTSTDDGATPIRHTQNEASMELTDLADQRPWECSVLVRCHGTCCAGLCASEFSLGKRGQRIAAGAHERHRTRARLASEGASAELPAVLDISATLDTDTGKGGRVNGKEAMARRRYQEGCLFTRGSPGRRVWVVRWREDILRADGTVGRMMRSQVLGPGCRIPSRREARQLMQSPI